MSDRNDSSAVAGTNDRIKSRQRVIMIVALVLILAATGVGLFLSGDAPQTAKPKPVVETIQPPGSISDRDAWRGLSDAKLLDIQQQIQRVAAEQANAKAAIDKVASDVAAQKAAEASAAASTATAASAAAAASAPAAALSTTAATPTTLNKPLPVGTTGRGLGGKRVLAAPGDNTALNTPIGESMPTSNELEIIDFDDNADAGGGTSSAGGAAGKLEVQGFPVDARARRYKMTTSTNGASVAGVGGKGDVNLLPAGSFIPVAMLNGVDAPTGGQAQSDPLSVDLQAIKPANLPNGKRLDVTGCRIVSSAWGDLSAERMMGRTQTLSCILAGRAIEIDIKGKLIGEDGKEGVRGRLVTKQGQLLANAILSGTLGGIGQAFQQSATVTSFGGGGVAQTIDGGQVGRAAIGGGVGTAGQMLAQYYLKAADKLFPVIETDATRTIEVSITKGVYVDAATAALFETRSTLDRSRNRNRRTRDE
ncbi:TraB/VirB10 family protein [Burkholderia pyrrocinia]